MSGSGSSSPQHADEPPITSSGSGPGGETQMQTPSHFCVRFGSNFSGWVFKKFSHSKLSKGFLCDSDHFFHKLPPDPSGVAPWHCSVSKDLGLCNEPMPPASAPENNHAVAGRDSVGYTELETKLLEAPA